MNRSGSNPLPLANEHFVQLYRNESELADTVASYALDVLDYERQGLLFFATRRHCERFKRALMLHDYDVGDAMARGQINFVHIEDILPKLMRGEHVDKQAFQKLAATYLQRAQMEGRYQHIHVFGEIVNVLWRQGNKAATLNLEHLWNELRESHAFTLYCAYQVDRHTSEVMAGDMRDALCTHNTFMSEIPVDGLRQRRVFSEVHRMPRPAVPPARPPTTSAPPHSSAVA